MEEEGSTGLWILRGPYWPPQVASVTCQGPLGKGTSSALLCPQDQVPPWGVVPAAESGHGEDRQGTLTDWGWGESLPRASPNFMARKPFFSAEG